MFYSFLAVLFGVVLPFLFIFTNSGRYFPMEEVQTRECSVICDEEFSWRSIDYNAPPPSWQNLYSFSEPGALVSFCTGSHFRMPSKL
jgi:hypothetical protein